MTERIPPLKKVRRVRERDMRPETFEQLRRASNRMQAFEDYAREIGCVVMHDTILARQEHGKLLSAKWRELWEQGD